MNPKSILYAEESYAIQGAIFEVYKEMGAGFLEQVYQECLEAELQSQNIPFISQPSLELNYKGNNLQQTYKPDFVCYGKIIIEIKAVKDTASSHKAQVINYLKATGFKLGFLVNFGTFPKVSITRLAL